MKLLAVPREYAFFSQCGGYETASVAMLNLLQRLFEIGLGHETAGEVSADDEVVDVFDEFFDARIEFIEIGDDWDAGGASPRGCKSCGGGVVAIDVKCPSIHDPFLGEIGRLKDEALVASAEDGSFAACVDEDQGLRARGAWDRDELSFNACMSEGFAVERGGRVIAEFPHVSGAHSPALTGDDCGCDLSPWQHGRSTVLDFGTA